MESQSICVSEECIEFISESKNMRRLNRDSDSWFSLSSFKIDFSPFFWQGQLESLLTSYSVVILLSIVIRLWKKCKPSFLPITLTNLLSIGKEFPPKQEISLINSWLWTLQREWLLNKQEIILGWRKKSRRTKWNREIFYRIWRRLSMQRRLSERLSMELGEFFSVPEEREREQNEEDLGFDLPVFWELLNSIVFLFLLPLLFSHIRFRLINRLRSETAEWVFVLGSKTSKFEWSVRRPYCMFRWRSSFCLSRLRFTLLPYSNVPKDEVEQLRQVIQEADSVSLDTESKGLD